MRVANNTEELDLHRNKIRVLAELDWLFPECCGHDQDVLRWSLEVNVECDRLICIQLEESYRLE